MTFLEKGQADKRNLQITQRMNGTNTVYIQHTGDVTEHEEREAV